MSEGGAEAALMIGEMAKLQNGEIAKKAALSFAVSISPFRNFAILQFPPIA
jgi:hypothetical protein